MIARFTADPAWPGPVWGVGKAVAYEAAGSGINWGSEYAPPFPPERTPYAELFRRPAGRGAERPHGLRPQPHRPPQRAARRDAVRTAFADPAARLYLFHGDKVFLKDTDPCSSAWPKPMRSARSGWKRSWLGWMEGGPRLAVVIPEAIAIAEGKLREIDLRTIAPSRRPSAPNISARWRRPAASLNCHHRHRFCSVWGQPSVMKIGAYRRDCPACGAEHFPRTDPVVIMLAIDGDRCLLGRQARFQPGMYSCLAGFVEPGETIEDAVRRETAEEAGIRVGRVRYHASQPWPFPSSLMIGCHAEAISTDIVRDETELEDCRWFPRAEVRTMLAGTHPDGLKTPPAMAIAHHLIRAWAEAG